MAGKGVRIKDLAGQLGVTSRQLIDRCREQGLPVQNSITKIPPAAERVIRGWYAENGTPRAPVRRPDTE